jgi:DNA polymerase epsilon subunit 1
LLKLTNKSSFSNEVSYENTKKKIFLLNDMFCENCGTVKDLNLFENNDKNSLVCNECSNNYNKDNVEYKLIELLNQIILSYQIQDLKCNKCSIIKENNISNNCDCSGTFVCKEDKNEIRNTINSLQSLSKFYKFEWLKEILSNLIF